MTEKMMQVHPDYEKLVEITEIEEHPDIFICLKYLLLKESKPKLSMEEIADRLANEFGGRVPFTRQGLYLRVEMWRRDGTLPRAEELFIAPKAEEIRAALGRAITAMPDMIDQLVIDATSPERSARDRLEIIQYLSHITRDEVDKQKQSGSEEKRFSKRPQSFDPTEIEDV